MKGVVAVASDAFRDRMMAATKVVRGQENTMRRRIAALYEECAKDMKQQILHYGEDSLTGRRAVELQKSMRGYVHRLWKNVEDMTAGAVYQGAALGIETQSSMLDDALHGVGLTTLPSFRSVFARTQDEAVASVINGTIYRGKHAGLSRIIWNNEALQAGHIEQLIAKAVAEGRSAPQLARDLEAYVNPKAMMPDHWNDIYEGLPFAYKVDYNAKRLAVTALNHAYYQGAIMAARGNPFAEFLHWQLSSGHEIYDICDLYMEHDEGLGLGNFSLDNAPLPHPFCRCTWYIDSNKSLEEIGEELGRWIGGEGNPKLDGVFAEWKQQMLPGTWMHYEIKKSSPGLKLTEPSDEVVQRVQSTVDRIVEDFPEFGKHLESVEFYPEPGIGAARTDGKVIRFDNEIFSNLETLQKVLNQSVATGHTVQAPTLCLLWRMNAAMHWRAWLS